MKKYITLVWFLTLLTSSTAQNVGQTKAYLLKRFELCEIKNNQKKALEIDCAGIRAIFFFNESGLCEVHMFEQLINDWNEMQVNIIWNGGKIVEKTQASIPNKSVKVPTLIYSDSKYDYFFYDTDFDGDANAAVKAVTVRKHKP